MKITTYRQAIIFLRGKGNKVAIQMGYNGPYIFVEKKDFIKTIKHNMYQLNLKSFTDYEGEIQEVEVFNNVLHIQTGIK